VASKWYELGVELLNEEQESQLDIIAADHKNDVERCCQKMFWFWLETHPDATWYQLVESLKSKTVRMDSLATGIEKMFAGMYLVLSTGTSSNFVMHHLHYISFSCFIPTSLG